MRKYYLFKVKNHDINAKKLYLILEELFYLNKNKFKYGIDIFKSICLPINKNELAKIKIKGIKIDNCCITLKCNNFLTVFKLINSLDTNIFVCDFENKDYFYLNDFITLNLKIFV